MLKTCFHIKTFPNRILSSILSKIVEGKKIGLIEPFEIIFRGGFASHIGMGLMFRMD